MKPHLWRRLQSLYCAGVKAPDGDRIPFVSGERALDKELRNELASSLKTKNDERTGVDKSTLEGPSHLLLNEIRPLSEGELILGRFRIVRHLGTGGMGDVYEAIDVELGRIALKTIRADMDCTAEMLSRFKMEVQLARKISGPNVCRVHELFVLDQDAGGAHGAFLTMEFLDGETLADKLKRSGPLPWREAQKICLEICEGLQTIHQAGIIHRDLKSRNIMLASRNGSTCAVLMDFGLAHEMSTPTSATRTCLTEPGAIIGTPDYMAPEQFEGKVLGPATDVYALGIVLYELVTAKHPFAASSPIGAAVLRGRRPCSASSIQPGLPRRFDEVICRCLEFDPKLRYQSAKEVSADLSNRLFSFGWLRQNRSRVSSIVSVLLALTFSLLLIPAIRERLRGMLFSSHEKHIAVLPFDFVGQDPETVALGDGVMDSLAGKLSNLGAANRSLWVVPASEVRRRKVNDPSSALREFGATAVIKGTFERSGEAARLNLTLIDTRRMREIGFADVESQTGDLGALQDDAVNSLGRLMNISVPEDSARRDKRPTSRIAYEEYLTGVGHFQRFDKPGNLDLASTALQNAVKIDPHFALGFARLAQVYIMKYRFDSNEEWLRLAEVNCRKAAALDDQVPSTYTALAQIHELTGNHDLAIQEFQRAIDLDSRDGEAVAGIAYSYQNAGRNSDAEAAYLKAAALRPTDWTGYNSLGNFYDSIGRPKEAIIQYHRALELTPDNSGLYTNLGAAYLDLDDPKMLGEAEKALKKSLSIEPTYGAYGNLAFLYAQEHRFGESISASQEALRLNNQSYDVWSNLTAAYEWLREDKKANAARTKTIALLEEAVRLNPQDARAQATLAAMRAKVGLRSKALDGIDISLALSPNSTYSLAEVADAYELLGDRQNAIKYLEKAVADGLPKGQLNEDPEIQGVIQDPRFKMPGNQSGSLAK